MFDDIYQNLIEFVAVYFLLCIASYVLIRVCGLAWFRSRRDHIDFLTRLYKENNDAGTKS